ncbi:hypothetical protein B0H19DRAFT_165213 [Mycena capillaripes]|nr:hypothetical protein B0H19DRAFT_165213 [Mycena capillaripes]
MWASRKWDFGAHLCVWGGGDELGFASSPSAPSNAPERRGTTAPLVSPPQTRTRHAPHCALPFRRTPTRAPHGAYLCVHSGGDWMKGTVGSVDTSSLSVAADADVGAGGRGVEQQKPAVPTIPTAHDYDIRTLIHHPPSQTKRIPVYSGNIHLQPRRPRLTRALSHHPLHYYTARHRIISAPRIHPQSTSPATPRAPHSLSHLRVSRTRESLLLFFLPPTFLSPRCRLPSDRAGRTGRMSYPAVAFHVPLPYLPVPHNSTPPLPLSADPALAWLATAPLVCTRRTNALRPAFRALGSGLWAPAYVGVAANSALEDIPLSLPRACLAELISGRTVAGGTGE